MESLDGKFAILRDTNVLRVEISGAVQRTAVRERLSFFRSGTELSVFPLPLSPAELPRVLEWKLIFFSPRRVADSAFVRRARASKMLRRNRVERSLPRRAGTYMGRIVNCIDVTR